MTMRRIKGCGGELPIDLPHKIQLPQTHPNLKFSHNIAAPSNTLVTYRQSSTQPPQWTTVVTIENLPPYVMWTHIAHIRIVRLLSKGEERRVGQEMDVLYKSTPRWVFRSQVFREVARLEYQNRHKFAGRRETLPLDHNLNLQDNAQNNVRARWIQQGIWGQCWGPAVPGDVGRRDPWIGRPPCPFGAGPSGETPKFQHGVRWGHEERATDWLAVTEEQARTQADDFTHLKNPDMLTDVSVPGRAHLIRRPRVPGPKPVRYIETRGRSGRIAEYPTPTPKVRDREASRPCHLFWSQLPLECAWVRDQMAFVGGEPATHGPATDEELQAVARRNLVRQWKEDGMWDRRWDGDGVPGMRWPYEDHAESQGLLDAQALNIQPGGAHYGHVLWAQQQQEQQMASQQGEAAGQGAHQDAAGPSRDDSTWGSPPS